MSERQSPTPAPGSRPAHRRLARTLILGVFGLLAGCGPKGQESLDPRVVARLDAQPTRPVRGRFVGAAHRPYQPPPGPKRGSDDGSPPFRGGTGGTGGSWLTPAEREVRAVEWLSAGLVTAAAEDLADLAAENPARDLELAPTLHLLAVARLEQASHEGDPALALMALGAAGRAWHLAPTAVARWNRAQALAAVPLPRRASRAWAEVQALEDEPEWRAEAQATAADLPLAPAPRRADLVTEVASSTPGRAELQRAIDLRRSEDREAAARAFARARVRLEAASDPLALRARLGVLQTTAGTTWADLDALLRAAAGQGGLPLAAVLREVGLRSGRDGRTETALDFYRQAEALLVAAEHEEAALLAAMVAEIYAEAGDGRAAWRALGDALRRSPQVADPLNRYSLFVVIASALRFLDPWAAVEVRREAAELCADLPERPLCPADSAIAVAGLLRKLGARPEAVEAELAAAAAALAAGLGAADGRRQSQADLAAEQARWLASPANPRRDLAQAVERSAEARRELAAQRRLPPYLRATEEAAGWLEAAGATQELAALLRDARLLVRGQSEPSQAARLAEPARALYHRLIAAELAAGSDAEALNLVDELLSLGHRRSAAPAALPPAGTAAVVYWTTGERAMAWLVTATGSQRFDLPGVGSPSGGEIAELATIRDESLWRERTAPWFERWLGPWVDELPADLERLVIIPDPSVAGLPFRALWDRQRGRYLEDAFAVELAPRLTGLPPAETGALPDSILAVGIAEFAPVLALADLAETTDEATAVAEVYPRRVSCKGSRWQDFRGCSGRAEVIHLATHGGSGDGPAGGDWLAFADETVGLDRLASELPDLGQARLVVLSACRSSSLARGLAGPFLGAGADTVVGSLWPIEDTASVRQLMTAFHAEYRRTGLSSVALRQARASHPALAARPWLWGAFIIVRQPLSGGS